MWKKSVSQSYNNDCQLPKSFSHLPALSYFEENEILKEHDNLPETGNPVIIAKNVPGRQQISWKFVQLWIYASHKKKENEKLVFVFLANVDVAVSSNDPIFTPRDEQPFINEDDGTTSDEDIVNVINVDK